MTPKSTHDAETLLAELGWVRALARRLVGQDADDLVQETWIQALRRPPRKETPVRPWLAAVVRNLAVNRRRSERHRTDREARRAADLARAVESCSTADIVARSEMQREVVDAVLALDEPYRTVLLLRYFEGLAPREIAERLGVGGSTVRSQLTRGIERLTETLDDRNAGDRAGWMRALAPIAGLPASAVPASLPKLALSALVLMPASIKLLALVVPLLVSLLWWSQRPSVPVAQEHAVAIIAVEESGASSVSLDPIGSVTEADAPIAARIAAAATESPSATRSSPFTITVVDAATGEPVAGWRFREALDGARGGGGDVSFGATRFTTDEAGRASVDKPFTRIVACHTAESSNRMYARFEPNAHARWPDPDAVTWSDGVGKARVQVGPTVLLDLAVPSGIPLDGLIGILSDDPYADSWAARISTVRQVGEATFVRFAKRVPEQSRSMWLHVLTLDGRFGASTQVDGRLNGQQIVSMTLQERGQLKIDVRADGGGELPHFGLLLLPGDRRLDDIRTLYMEALPRLLVKFDRRPAARRFEYDAIPPGMYTILVEARGFAPRRQIVDVEPGEARVEIALDRVDPLTSVIEGQVTSRSGTYSGRLRVAIHFTGHLGNEPVTTDVVWADTDRGRVGSFRVEGLANEPHRVTLEALGGDGDRTSLGSMLPPGLLTATPGELFAIELEDDFVARSLEVRVKDSVTGEAVQKFSATVMDTELRTGRSAGTLDGVAVVEGIRWSPACMLTVSSSQHRMLQVSLEEYAEGGSIEVELVPGWTGAVVVRTLGDHPVEGFDVLIEGVRVGVTDARGAFMLDLDAAPMRVEVRKAGWRLERGDVVDEDGVLHGRYERTGSVVFMRMVPVD